MPIVEALEGWDGGSPCSANEVSATQGGREELSGLLPTLGAVMMTLEPHTVWSQVSGQSGSVGRVLDQRGSTGTAVHTHILRIRIPSGQVYVPFKDEVQCASIVSF